MLRHHLQISIFSFVALGLALVSQAATVQTLNIYYTALGANTTLGTKSFPWGNSPTVLT